MRARLLFIVLAALAVAGLAALNWAEVTRTAHLNFGLILADAPLAGILLGLLALTLAVFLVSSAIQESRNLLAWNRHSRELQAQRDLADRAEASRFTELRQHIDATLRDARQRDWVNGSDFERSTMQSHRELRAQLDTMNRMLLARLAELEARLERRPAIADPLAAPQTVVAPDEPPRQRAKV